MSTPTRNPTLLQPEYHFMTLPSFIWDSPLKTFKALCISLWTEPQSYYSCHIPCTLHSMCNDVSNNLLMLTAPCEGIFYLWLAMTQAAGVTSAPAAFSSRALRQGELMLSGSCHRGWRQQLAIVLIIVRESNGCR